MLNMKLSHFGIDVVKGNLVTFFSIVQMRSNNGDGPHLLSPAGRKKSLTPPNL